MQTVRTAPSERVIFLQRSTKNNTLSPVYFLIYLKLKVLSQPESMWIFTANIQGHPKHKMLNKKHVIY